MFDIASIEKKLGYSFVNKNLLRQAFIHPSFHNEHLTSSPGHNERLEFLGDSILSWILTDFLYHEFPGASEGYLSKTRSYLIDASFCRKYLELSGLQEYLLLGKGELLNHERGKHSARANLFEAVIAALYLDGGSNVAKKFVIRFLPTPQEIASYSMVNPKSLLQEYTQRKFKKTPTYEISEKDSSDNRKLFQGIVKIDSMILGTGKGFSKKEAEKQAAEKALSTIQDNDSKN
ncbi:ribonuclease III [Candidatus Clavichlamydia salmonicola]|uniref:ribonuclease III n=1 Tax=Candidatus Clavichlamydia salmonicola TaxID=469812 RepID=UPI0018919A55|nr:ribonuclease III [Candidatus Clavichlamydia salmonicola]